MKREFSLYLDLIRFLASILVVVTHINHRAIIAEPLPQLGHDAVMIFFVLSGFVIAFITDKKESDPRSYSISRIARIYSVAPVAILLTLLLDPISLAIDPRYIGESTLDLWSIRAVSSFFFVNEIWGVSIQTFSNVPYWSLNYEVWYYVMFGIIVFTSGMARVVSITAILLFLGPKILLLAPIWWLGVFLYRSQWLAKTGEAIGWLLFASSFALFHFYIQYDVRHMLSGWLMRQIGEHWFTELAWSKWFISDYLVALIVTLNFVGFRAIAHRFSGVLSPCAKPIRSMASYTFALYLLHQPLIWFFAALIQGDPQQPYFLLSVLFLVALSVYLLGQVTEHRKQFYRRWATYAVDIAVGTSRRLGKG